MQGREGGWTLQPNWSGVVAEALEPEREPVLERAWMLILGQQPLEPILKPEREPLLGQQAWPVLSVQRLPRHLGIRCPAYTFQLGTNNALPFVC